MNQLVRACTIVLAVGAALAVAGAAAGGTLYSTIDSEGIHPWNRFYPRLRWETESEYEERTGSSRGNSGSVWDGSRKAPRALDDIENPLPELTEPLPEVDPVTRLTKIDFELGAGNYTIVEGDSYGLEADGDWVRSDIDNGVWKIRTEKVWSNLGRHIDRNCTITVPAGCTVQTLDWVVGAANVEVSAPIHAEKGDFEIGAGNLEIDSLTVSGKLDIEVGAGNLEIGSLTVSDRLDIEIGAGYAGLGLAGSWEDYRIDAEVAMGSVTINGRDLVSGLAGSASKGDGKRKIDAEVGMGAIDITTESA